MSGFITTKEYEKQPNENSFNELVTSAPQADNLTQLLMFRATFQAKKGHPFHKHPGREEVIYVLEGEIEQWVGNEKKILKTGDSVMISAGEVHATYNISDKPAVILAILSPRELDEEIVVDVFEQKPWKEFHQQYII